jgi:DNA processing protein
MTEQDLFYLLALQRVEGVGDIMAKKLLTHCGSAEAVLKQRPLNLLPLMAWVLILRNLKSQAILIKPMQN